MLNVRLNKEEEERLADYCQRMNRTKSDVVKEALVAYLASKAPVQSAFELGEDLFGEDRGDAKGSAGYKQTLKKKLGEKHAR